MAWIVRVKPGGGVLVSCRNGQQILFKAGQLIDQSELGIPTQTIEDWRKSGHVEAVNDGTEPGKDVPTEDIPGLDKTAPVPGASPRDDRKAIEPILTHGKEETPALRVVSGKDSVEVSATGPTREQVTAESEPSPWTLDPDSLTDLNLEQLNVMVQERDASQDPFEDENEARCFLSRDFKPKA